MGELYSAHLRHDVRFTTQMLRVMKLTLVDAARCSDTVFHDKVGLTPLAPS